MNSALANNWEHGEVSRLRLPGALAIFHHHTRVHHRLHRPLLQPFLFGCISPLGGGALPRGAQTEREQLRPDSASDQGEDSITSVLQRWQTENSLGL